VRAPPRPGDHAEPAALAADELDEQAELAVGELPRVDVAEEDDVVLHDLLQRLRGTAASGRETCSPGLGAARRLGGVALLGEAGVGAREDARDVHGLVPDHLVLEVPVLPPRVAVDVEDVDLARRAPRPAPADVVARVELARLLLGDRLELERADLLGLEGQLDLERVVVGQRDGALDRPAVGGAERRAAGGAERDLHGWLAG
jgi:hypothetical protein